MLMNAKKVFMVVIAMLRVTTRKVPRSAFAKSDLVGTEETAVNVSHLLVYNFSNWAKGCQGIEHRVTSLYNPQSNGGVERFNRTMEEGIQASMAEGKSFAEAVRTTLCNYRATQHALTGTSPAELMIGRKLILSLDNLKPLKLFNMRLPLRRSNTLPLSRKH